ncbi:hypothetical protein CRUP_038402 [Coryphaenoides rupestris]|nr:hypothetical protein CRUP_038402 [Coryphaenoides rupestris]
MGRSLLIRPHHGSSWGNNWSLIVILGWTPSKLSSGDPDLGSHVALPEYRREDLEELLIPELAPEIIALAADASVVCWPLDSRWDAEEPMTRGAEAEWVSVEKSGL